MPVYEYLCNKCGEKFSLVMSVGQHEKEKVKCQKCQSADVEQLIEPFFAVTSKKS